MFQSVLLDRQKTLNPRFTEVHGWQLSEVYTTVQQEYAAARAGVAVKDWSHAGRLRLTGRDRLDFVHRMSTNDVRGLLPGDGMSTILPSATGRIVDWVVLYVEPESLWMVTSPQNREKDVGWLRRYIFFRDQVKVEDLTSQTAMLTVYGPQSADLLADVLGTNMAGLPLHHWLTTGAVRVARTEGLGRDAFNVWGETEPMSQAWDRLVGAGALPLGEAAFEVLRIEAGWPVYGRELSEEINPHEARLLRAVSFTKGCYIGQEVIARLDTYHKVQKYLVGLLPEASLTPGMRLEADSKNVGWVTSVVDSMALGRPIALGYVRTAYAEAGQAVTAVQDGQRIVVEVTGLPFKAGS
jgi:folate-binding protein YgfZ